MRFYISTEEASFFESRKMGVGNEVPTSGVYNAGDFIISGTQANDVFGWVCISAGNPGTWVELYQGKKIKDDIKTVTDLVNQVSTDVGIVGNNVNTVETNMGNLSNLVTEEKQTIVAAINEIKRDITTPKDALITVNVVCDDEVSTDGVIAKVNRLDTSEFIEEPVTNGKVHLTLKIDSSYEISVGDKEGYVKPSNKIIYVSGNETISMTYVRKYVDVVVNASIDTNESLSGRLLTVKRVSDNVTSTHDMVNNTVRLKLLPSTQYEFNVNDLLDASTPSKVVLTTPVYGDNSTVVNIQYKKIIVYGFDIDETNSNPETAVTYTDSAIGLSPIRGNNGTTDYGSWKDTFIWKSIKPCLVNSSNRSVNYYLNPDDYTKREDGTASDITTGNDGDVMVEFKPTWYKIWKEGTTVKFRVSNYKQEGYVNYAFISEKDKTSVEPMYYGAYNGTSLSSKLRSLSGVVPYVSHTIGTGRAQAASNNGYITRHRDRQYVNMLLILVMKSRDCQSAIGQGRVNSSSAINTGAMNGKGMFWGNNNGTDGCKVFGIENYWGNIYQFMDGLCANNGIVHYQNMGPYTDDLSNKTSAGFTYSSGYIKTCNANNELGLLSSDCSGSSTTYYPDYQYMNSSGYRICYVGGYWSGTTYAGFLCVGLGSDASVSSTNIGSRLAF